MTQREIRLDDLLEAAAQSFGTAQQEVGLPQGLKSAMLISTAELAIKAGMRFAGGKMMIEPVTAAASAKGSVDPAALSTITIRYVAAQSDVPAAQQPQATKEEIAKEVASRPDIVKLQDIIGTLTIQPNYVPNLKTWTVKVTDASDRTVRLLTLEDRK